MGQYKNDLRQRVYTLIDKLSDRATLSQSTSELQLIARSLDTDNNNNIGNNSLSIYLSCILSVDGASKPAARVGCLNLLAQLAQAHGGPGLSPHLPKIVSFLVKRLRDPDSSVRVACAAATSAVAEFGFGSLVGPMLSAVLSEQDGGAQIGGCACLRAAVDGGHVDGRDEAELRRALPRLVGLARRENFKGKGAVLGLVGSVVGVNDGGVVNGRGALVASVAACAAEMLAADDWAARKAAAEVLEAVAVRVERETAAEVKGVCVAALEAKRFDKVKITRETMNRALEAWREVPGSGPLLDLPLSRSNSSSTSKDNGNGGRVSPPVSRRYSFAGTEAPKPKKSIAKTRSSLSDGLLAASPSPSLSSSNSEAVGLETPPQRKRTISKSRSSLSDDSTITDSSCVSRGSHDIGLDPFHPKRPPSKNRPSRGNEKRSSAWSVEAAAPPLPSTKAESEDDVESQLRAPEVTTSESEMRWGFSRKSSEEREQKLCGLRSGSRVVPFVEGDESEELFLEEGVSGEVGENNVDAEDLSLIRKQLLQIERQQSSLLDLIQRFMGNSQSGINSLETRVSGLERALDEISYDLAMQNGRPPSDDSAGSTCCPSTEFLSPKFWRRTEGRSSTSKPSSHPGSFQVKDGNAEAPQVDGHRLQDQNEGAGRDSWGSVEFNSSKSARSVSQNGHRGRMCSPRSFDAASTGTCLSAGVRGT